MSGQRLMISSPSSSRIRRSTPCVLGCCGPMLMNMRSPCSSLTCLSCARWADSIQYKSLCVLMPEYVHLFGQPRMDTNEHEFRIRGFPHSKNIRVYSCSFVVEK